VAIFAFRYYFVPGAFALDSGHVYATAAGEQREWVLKDGSIVTLGASSSLTVTFTHVGRVAVLDRGEARFRVQHDRWRPFTVFAGAGSVTAVGTVFDVRRYSNHVFVTVSEGAVEVAPQQAPAPDPSATRSVSQHRRPWVPLRVARGEEMTYDFTGDASAARPTEALSSPSWIGGAREYRERPLREVIEDVQRYSPRLIQLDTNAADLQFTGTFLEHDVERWLHGLAKVLPVEVVDSHLGPIVIRPKLAPQQNAYTGPRR
jgi:transmembrane sensor